MSRLAEHQKKQFRQNLIIGSLILIALFIFLLTYGLKFLLNASIFVGRLANPENSQPSNKNHNLISDVDIYDIPTATNSANIIVGGSVINFEKVEFYLNGDLVKETTLVSSDNFSEEIGDLKEGENEVFVIAKNKDQNDEKKSSTLTVLYKKDKPKLNIKEPQDNLKTNQQDLNISGETDKEIYIKINEFPVVVDAQGVFQTSVRLKDGENKIKIIAEDVAGNIEEKILNVTYAKD